MRKFLFFGFPLRSVAKALVLPTLGIVTGFGVSVAVTAMITPSYEARSAVLILPQTSANPDDSGRPTNISVAQNLAPTLARLTESREVAVDIANTLQVSDDEVFGHVSGESEPGIQIINITATASTPEVAAARADAAAGALERLSARLRLGGENQVTVQTLDRAGLPGAPTFPKPLLNYSLGAMVGLLVGMALATLHRRVDDRFRQVTEVETELGLPVLGTLGKAPSRRARDARHLFHRGGVAASVNALVASLSVLNTSGHRRILVTSTREDDSGSYVAALLTVGLCQDHALTTLVEGRAAPSGGSTLDRYFPGRAGRTVEHALARGTGPADGPSPVVLSFPSLRQHFDTSTPRPDQIGTLVNGLASDGDHVVVTAPPVMAGPDLLALSRYADVVLLVVPTDRVSRSEAARASALVRRLGVQLAGVVVLGTAADEVGLRPTTPAPAAQPTINLIAQPTGPLALPAPLVLPLAGPPSDMPAARRPEDRYLAERP